MPKTVLITGSSTGLGRAIAHYFAERGWNVAATCRHPESAAPWVHGGNVITPALDVTVESTIAAAVTETVERFGGIDVVVNNAGYGLFGPMEGVTAGQLESIFRTNVFGTAAVIRHVLPVMRRNGGGTIVNMSSVAGLFGSAMLAPYSATKYAVEGLSESLRFELKAHNVRVKLVEPGHFKSDFITRSLQWATHPAYEARVNNMKYWVERSGDRAGDPRQVAEALFRAANDTSGRLRYRVGGMTLMWMRALLPDVVWRWMLGAGMERPPRETQRPANLQRS